jgi:superfamily II DNA or RNA helicase
MGIIAGGGKAEVGHRQRIGRTLRQKKTGKNQAFILDFEDKGNHYLSEHAAARRAIIENTPGFAENILPAGADFPY